MQKMKGLLLLTFIFVIALISGCVNAPQDNSTKTATNAPASSDPNKKIKIGFAMDTLKEERWVRDKEAFEAHCKELNVDCEITVADNKADKQANDVENLLTKK